MQLGSNLTYSPWPAPQTVILYKEQILLVLDRSRAMEQGDRIEGSKTEMRFRSRSGYDERARKSKVS